MSHRLPVVLMSACLAAWVSSAIGAEDGIHAEGSKLRLQAGILQRMIDIAGGELATTSLTVAGQEILAARAQEFTVTISRAEPNRRPPGLKPGAEGTIDSVKMFARWD